MPVLVDSSLWVHQLRKSGDPAKRERVNALLEAGRRRGAAVRLELWRGVTNDVERKTLRRYEALLPDYEMTDRHVDAVDATGRPRGSGGVTVPWQISSYLRAGRSTSSRSRTTTPTSTS